MKQKKENRVALLLHWAGEQKSWLFLAIFYRRSVAFALSFLTLEFTG
jgi:hypothetical protein